MLARNEGGGMDGVRLVSWNVAGRKEPWRELVKMGAFIGSVDPSTHRILAAGDLNMAYGTLDNSWESLAVRERTVFDRMEALGLKYLGPQFPAGRRADPTPAHLPEDTRNVPTFFSNKEFSRRRLCPTRPRIRFCRVFTNTSTSVR